MSSAIEEKTINGQTLSVFVLIDALGWKYLEGREFLADLLPYRHPLHTILGFSSGAIPTMLTGLPPSQHGHWNLFYYDPQGSPFKWLRYLQFLPKPILDSRVCRKIVKELGRRVFGMGPLFECCVSPRLMPYFNWIEKRNIYDQAGIAGAPSIFDWLAKEGIRYRVYSYHHATDAEILGQAKQDIGAGKSRFFFLYLSEMDMFLHMNCTDGRKVEERLRWYEESLREVFRVAREADPAALFTIASDHGMTPITDHYDLVKEIELLGLSMPQDYLAVYDSTMARYWFFSDKARRRIEELLQSRSCGRIVPDKELQQLGIFFPDRRFGEVIFLLNPGWILSRSDFNGPGWRPLGMHGYHPTDVYSDGVFLASREPAIHVRNIADVYSYMLRSAQLEPVSAKTTP